LTNKKKIAIELLAPAKDAETGIAAINHGADAVYIGAPKFGARSAAGNRLEDIQKLIAHAHLFYAKVYVTINTILYDEELEEVRQLIYELEKIDADAIIIQDMALFEMELPPIPLFASTQTHNYSLERIKFLEENGLQRIILARELSLEHLHEIRKQTTIDLEFFIHGALCVCYSGQCYFSFATTGRSANRGECSQACRMLYTLEDAAGTIVHEPAYLLSMKDLNLSTHLHSLLDAGITSFKIEGRLKDDSYVKNITAFYRQKLDELLASNPSFKQASSGKIHLTFVPDPEKTFSRGYTDYFLSGEGNNLSSLLTPKAVGKFIGEVTNVFQNYFEIKTEEVVVNGDGICFFDNANVLVGTNINRVEGNKIFTSEPLALTIGTKIYRNYDHQFLKELSKEETQRKISCIIFVSFTSGTLTLTAYDEDGNKVTLERKNEFQPPKNELKAMETILHQLQKAGATIFSVEQVTVDSEEIYFLPVSQWNDLRRSLLNLLLEERIKNYPLQRIERRTGQTTFPQKSLDYSGNVVNRLAKNFYLKHGVEEIEEGFEKADSFEGKALMTTKYCIKEELEICPLKKGKSSDTKNAEPLYLNDGKQKFRLQFNCKKCEMEIYL